MKRFVVRYLRVKLYAVLANKNNSHFSLLISLQRPGYPKTIIKKFKIYMLSEPIRASAV